MNQPLCSDPECPIAWAEHDAHDGLPTRAPADETCTDPKCPDAAIEHDAHGWLL